MYYIGEVLFEDLNWKGKPMVELWNDTCYSSEVDAKKALERIKEETNRLTLQIVNDKKYDVYTCYPWLKE